MSKPDLMQSYPPGVVLHVPHNSTVIPPEIREQFILNDNELHAELIRMTDHRTINLFCETVQGTRIVVAPFSRLVVDVERFEDEQEPMAAKGMGIIYRLTSDGKPLRRDLSVDEREHLISTYYRPHHRQLGQTVNACLQAHGFALIIDAHSFQSMPYPYEEQNQNSVRPDVCIGTDIFHTPKWVQNAFVERFLEAGFTVMVNHPFAGAIVPLEHYQRNGQVWSILVEINRRLYLDEATGDANSAFNSVAERVRSACLCASSIVVAACTRSNSE